MNFGLKTLIQNIVKAQRRDSLDTYVGLMENHKKHHEHLPQSDPKEDGGKDGWYVWRKTKISQVRLEIGIMLQNSYGCQNPHRQINKIKMHIKVLKLFSLRSNDLYFSKFYRVLFLCTSLPRTPRKMPKKCLLEREDINKTNSDVQHGLMYASALLFSM